MNDVMVCPDAGFVGFVRCTWCCDGGADTAVVTAKSVEFALHSDCIAEFCADRDFVVVEEV